MFVFRFASQLVSVRQATHCPALGLPGGAQKGVAPVQSLATHARHTPALPQMGVPSLQPALPSHEQGSPDVLNSNSRTSCSLVPPPPVDAVNPANACAPTAVETFTNVVAIAVAGFVPDCAR